MSYDPRLLRMAMDAARLREAGEMARLRAQVEQLTAERDALGREHAAALAARRAATKEEKEVRAERDALRQQSREFAGMNRSVGIATPCPTCGRPTLFVGSDGHLTCSRTLCSEPSVEAAVTAMKAKSDALFAAQGELVAALRAMRDVFTPRGSHDMDGFVQAKAHELAEDVLAKHGGQT